VKPEAQLRRDGHVDGFDEPAGHRDGVVGDAQHHRPGERLGDLVDRAAHVDVDRRGPVGLGPPGGLGHDVRILAVELHAERLVVGIRRREPLGLLILLENPVRTQQIGKRQAQPAAGARRQAKRQITMPGHGGQQQGRVELDRADCQHDANSIV